MATKIPVHEKHCIGQVYSPIWQWIIIPIVLIKNSTIAVPFKVEKYYFYWFRLYAISF